MSQDCSRRSRALVVGHVGFDYYIDEKDLSSSEALAGLITKEDFQNYIMELRLMPYLGGTAGNVAAVMRAIGSLEVDRFTCGDPNGLAKYDEMTPKECQPQGEINKSISADDYSLCVPICLIVSKEEDQEFLLYDPTLNVYNAVQEFNLVRLDNEREYELLHITTVPPNATLKLVEEARLYSPDTVISFCPGQNLELYHPKTLFKVLKDVDILFVNDKEMELLSEWIFEYSEYFMGFPGLIVHTRGSRPTVISSEGFVKHIPTVKPSRVVDTTGAGDSYAGAFLSDYMVYKDPVRAAKFAATVASFIVEEVGCQTNIPDWHQIYERCKIWKESEFI